MTRKGKIARLPRALREELNQRLENGEPARLILGWLNEQDTVRQVLARDFGGRAISEQNLSEWRQGGFREWQQHRELLAEARELAANGDEIAAAGEGHLTDHLATVVAARYAAALSRWSGEPDEAFSRSIGLLRSVSVDIAELRRGDHSAARIELERVRLGKHQEPSKEEKLALMRDWARDAELREAVCGRRCRPEDQEAAIRRIFGMEGDGGISGQIRSNQGKE